TSTRSWSAPTPPSSSTRSSCHPLHDLAGLPSRGVGEREGDRVGVEAAPTVLVEAVEPEVGDVEDVGPPGDDEIGDRLRDAGTPHHPVATGGGDEDALDRAVAA